ncbi:MAG: hypothetical protein ABSE49_33915 [Polyangiaceae bacterium]
MPFCIHVHAPAWLAPAAVLLFAASARAADPTTAECLAANESSISHRNEHKLREARAQLLVCAAASCPGEVRNACLRRATAVNAAMPTIVFEAKDGLGNDLTAVSVSMDGQRLLDKLDGIAMELDPGPHQLTFEMTGRPAITRTIVLNEGEKDRREQVVFANAEEPPKMVPVEPPPAQAPAPPVAPLPVPPPAAPAAPWVSSSRPEVERGSSTSGGYWTWLRTTGVVAAGAGVLGMGIGGLVGLSARSEFEKAEGETGTPRINDSASAVRGGNAATAVVGVGAVVATVGLLVWLLAPSETTAGSTRNELPRLGRF